MSDNPLFVTPKYQPVFRELGIDAEAVFEHPLIKPWRTLDDRENCTLDAKLHDGREIRWHVKRYRATRRSSTPADQEVNGFKLLQSALIPTLTLVARGKLADGRSFLITEDLTGYQPADKLLADGFEFDRLRNPIADVAAELHRSGLHHRDLYLCHFFVRVDEDAVDVKLIDVARVKKLPALLTRQRWIVKDLAQFWYSTLSLPITEPQREAWLARYMEKRGETGLVPLKRAIEKKVARIAKHDAKLRKKQPNRNISIPK
jgi:lipopolysaccharide core heptose(I) kinase